jgi:alkanesulfonate monooxygenase SsuD/methylene tetrahydromethanopterin reductase-like flavin-dependent oxidoreductase (luciferase family)
VTDREVSTACAPAETQPQLSFGLRSFSAGDPGGWTKMFEFARAADAAGVDRLVVSDHVVFGERLEEYSRPETGGIAGGKQPTGPDGHWLEPLTTLAVVAGMTSRVRLRTHIIIAALRRPVVLAKSAATLDVLSGGRLDLGVGVGWQSAEYEAAGLPFEGRGRLLDHTLDVCQVLWR